jgi:hypothetical protein
MLTSIQGTFRNGRVELDEDPGIVGEAAVVVTFLKTVTPAEPPQARPIRFGMLGRPGRPMSDLEDFKDAEFPDRPWEGADGK